MIPALLRDLDPNQDTPGTWLNILQQWVEQAVINAGIPIPMSTPLLRDIGPGDVEGTKYAILQQWLKLLANGLSPASGGTQASVVALTAGTSSIAVSFATAFVAAPSVICNLVPPGGGDLILVAPVSITVNGFTANWGFAMPAGYSLAWQAVPKTQ